MQVTYGRRGTCHIGPSGTISVHPLRKDASATSEGELRLVPDDCAEIASTRVVDRLEVLAEGVERVGHLEYVVAERSRSHARLVGSGRVYLAECDFLEGCEMQAA